MGLADAIGCEVEVISLIPSYSVAASSSSVFTPSVKKIANIV